MCDLAPAMMLNIVNKSKFCYQLILSAVISWWYTTVNCIQDKYIKYLFIKSSKF